jgi:hypothetical protein
MSLSNRIRSVLKLIAFGPVRPAQKFFLGQYGDQKEVTVWLHGMGAPYDVTRHHSLACASPLTLCIAFDNGCAPASGRYKKLTLKFCERDGERRILGRLRLKMTTTMTTSGPDLAFFEITSARSYCLPLARLWIFYLHLYYRKWRKPPKPNIIKMSFLGMRGMDIIFSLPRLIGVASAADGAKGNVFPLNVMGQLDDGYFGFGLKDARFPAHLVERTRRVALSTIPIERGDLGYGLGPNHSKDGVDWDKLPFATKPSPGFKIPMPEFALRVRELEVEQVRKLGTHMFFVAKVVHDERFADGVEWCVVHGHYQTWRLKSRPDEIESSIAEDTRIKRAGDPHGLLT